MMQESKNPWTKKDEGIHPKSLIEWWCPEAFFKTKEDNRKWHLNASFTEFGKKGKTGSIYKTTFFDQTNQKNFEHLEFRKHAIEKDKSVKEGFFIKNEYAHMRGLFPNYHFHLHDPKNDITIDYECIAKSIPHWVARDITGGWLPWGLGVYRYGYIPKCDIKGTLNFENKKYTLEGLGYFEHVWGDFSFSNPADMLSVLKRSIGVNSRLLGWWISHNKIQKLPEKISFCSENNPIGYDWVWAVLDNGWTIFYGNIMMWVMQGPGFGTFILSKDDENYIEFAKSSFKYNKIEYSKKFDFYYPTEMEVTATNKNEVLKLKFIMNSECREFVQKLAKNKSWVAFVICEAPGIVEGYYTDGKTKTEIKGICKIEPQRQVSKDGHSYLALNFHKPPKGLGFSVDYKSHHLEKNISLGFKLLPRPKIIYSNEKIDTTNIHKK